MTEVLALIPARGGSKSIPRKNIKPFAGHPLIAYSIAAGQATKSISRLIVSTDDEEIARVARSYGAETPFLRPAELAQDRTTDLPVFQHALRWLHENEGYQPEIVVHLRPTSPLRRVWQIEQAIEKLLEHPEVDAVRTVSLPSQNPFKMYRIGANGLLQPLGWELGVPGEPFNMPRQSLPEVYWHNGYVDAVWSKTILEKDSMTGTAMLPLVIDPSDCVDIDSLEDWKHAEAMLKEGSLRFTDLGFEPKLQVY